MLITPTRLLAPAPGYRPSLALTFAGKSALDTRITFTRASAGTHFDNAAALQSATTDVPRFDHDSSGAPKGLLLEGARTNSLFNSATPATQTRSLTAATYLLWVVGSGSCELSGGPTGTATEGSPVAFTLGSTTSVTFTVTGSLTRFQCEVGAIATSFIATAGASATRALDLAKVSTLTPWFNAAAGTVYTEFMLSGVISGSLQTAVAFDDGTANERMTLRTSSGTLAVLVVDGGATQATLSLGALSANTVYKAAFRYGVNDFAASLNGGAVVTDTSATLPTVTQMVIGSRVSGTEMLYGWSRAVRYWPYGLTDNQLIALTK